MDINRKAPVKADAETLIAAPLSLVWTILTDLESWVEWNPGVTGMDLRGPTTRGTEFHWKAGSNSISSTIEEVRDRERIVWSGRTFGIRAVHSWTLEDWGYGVLVRTEESFQGLLATIFARPLRKKLDDSLSTSLAALSEECRRRVGDDEVAGHVLRAATGS
jgi:uncharacterized protein YndB with AHSA1/START domain